MGRVSGGGKWGRTQGALLAKVSLLMAVGCHCRVLSSRITWSELCCRKIPLAATAWRVDWRWESWRPVRAVVLKIGTCEKYRESSSTPRDAGSVGGAGKVRGLHI